MRRAPFFALISLVLVFLASCVDRDPTGPDDQVGEPNFSSHLSECWPDDVIGQINALFPEGGTRTAALKRYSSILRDVDRGRLEFRRRIHQCTDPGERRAKGHQARGLVRPLRRLGPHHLRRRRDAVCHPFRYGQPIGDRLGRSCGRGGHRAGGRPQRRY